MIKHSTRKLFKIVQMIVDDHKYDVPINVFVGMDDDIAKPYRSL